MKLFYSIYIVVFLSLNAMAHSIEELQIDDSKIYTTSVQLSPGEIAYFGFEPIVDQNRSKQWVKYKKQTENYYTSSANRSFFYSIFASGLEPELYDEYKQWALDLFQFNFNCDDEVGLWDLIINVPQDKAKLMAEAMSGIASGCIGLHTSIGDYIAYISKEPITGFFPLPNDSSYSPNLKDYIKDYDSLIMVVSSFEMGSNEKFQHRGIFRNPISMLRKDYKGVGVLLHAFAACARSMIFPENKIMYVNPDGNYIMEQLLINAFSPNITKCSGQSDVEISVENLKSKFEEIVKSFKPQIKL
ncbi:MAG: hypothetical protein Q8S21_05850 [Candidatus Paracaedibacteraceae bacterium]|nr:hypothetical protein [Candidatus Paracaedibacteraceae bacterium]